MESRVKQILDAYHQRMAEEAALMKSLPMEEGMKRRDEFLLPVGEETGIFLNTLIKSTKAQTVLEIGTSYGYSAIWLAEAVKQNGGKLFTLEIDHKKSDYARSMLQEAGLADAVDIRIGDALERIEGLPDKIDFVLIDIWKELYRPCFEKVYPKLKKGAFVIADNMIDPPFHKEETDKYKQALLDTKSFDTVLLPIGSGIEVSHFRK